MAAACFGVGNSNIESYDLTAGFSTPDRSFANFGQSLLIHFKEGDMGLILYLE